MEIKKFGEISFNVIDILDMCLDELIQRGELDEKDDTCLYHMFHTFSNWDLIKRRWKKDFDFISQYFHEPSDNFLKMMKGVEVEEVTTLELNENKWVVLGFDDSYEGLKFTFKSRNGKLDLVNCVIADENMCNQEGIDVSEIFE